MSRSIVRLIFCCSLLLLSVSGQSYEEKYRLQVHYSLPSGWANDPNGLVYSNGHYHLFYQNNPFAATAGRIHWGHARSKDLIHWENLPIALKPKGQAQMFSGCCLVDEKNSTGIAKANQPKALLAIYTHHARDAEETQVMSYSFDDGLTWTDYKDNPIVPNPGIADFRDPNIIERDGVYYMALAVHDRISFYSSKNLISWTPLSSFGVQPDKGDKTGVWECPSVISLKDEKGRKHDILIVSENGVSNGSLTQYFVGAFDGAQFKSYNQSDVLWIDNGFDNYAGIPYHNDPKGRAVFIGWMSNWIYGADIPTNTWRGQFTIPRELSLKTVNRKLHVAQRPVEELNDIVDSNRKWSLPKSTTLKGKQTVDFSQQIPFKTGSLLTLEYAIDIGSVKCGEVTLQLGNDLGEHVSLTFDIAKKTYGFDRRNSGNVTFNDRFADRVARADRISTSKVLSGLVLLDVSSIEIFADDGLNTYTSLFFPTEPYENIKVISNVDDSKRIKVKKMNVAALNSIWK